jgi:ATP-dependent Clp protease protease subunit
LDLKKQLNEIYVKHTGKKYEEVEKACDRDNYLDPVRAKEFGLIDNIIAPKGKTKKA